MTAHPLTHPPNYLHIYAYINLSIHHSSIHQSNHPIYSSIHLSIHPSIHLPIHPTIHLPTYPPIHPTIQYTHSSTHTSILCFFSYPIMSTNRLRYCFFHLLYVFGLHVSMYCLYVVPQKSEEGIGCPGTGVPDGYELPCGC